MASPRIEVPLFKIVKVLVCITGALLAEKDTKEALYSPAESAGGVQFQVPLPAILTLARTGLPALLIVIMTFFPGTPVPLKKGVSEGMTALSFGRVTAKVLVLADKYGMDLAWAMMRWPGSLEELEKS